MIPAPQHILVVCNGSPAGNNDFAQRPHPEPHAPALLRCHQRSDRATLCIAPNAGRLSQPPSEAHSICVKANRRIATWRHDVHLLLRQTFRLRPSGRPGEAALDAVCDAGSPTCILPASCSLVLKPTITTLPSAVATRSRVVHHQRVARMARQRSQHVITKTAEPGLFQQQRRRAPGRSSSGIAGCTPPGKCRPCSLRRIR